MQWSLARGFLKFVNTMEQSGISRLAIRLETGYRSGQSWEFLRQDPARWQKLITESLPETGPPPGERGPIAPPPPERMPPHPPELPGGRNPELPPGRPHNFDQRLFLLDQDRKVIIGAAEVLTGNRTTPLMYQGTIVGYLGLLPRTHISEVPHKHFLKEQKQALALQAAVIVILAALFSLLVARRLVRPLHKLGQATHQLAAGEFTVRVPVTSEDELGLLANDFNVLAASLEKSEQSRRQWVADISHELRTPLAILRGEIEALQDGIHQPTPESISSLHSETLRLGRLVDDLYQLSLSDMGVLTYQKNSLDLSDLLRGIGTVYQPRCMAKGINLEMDLPLRGDATIWGDQERLYQLFSNLFDNALKYTDAGGEIRIMVQQDRDHLTVDLKDSAPGASLAELERLFDRLYRVESSRNRLSGGAGLGLAICRTIVEAHQGKVTAQPSDLGGVLIRVELPKMGN
jgi:two-component system sensor histidine kinase BaeS